MDMEQIEQPIISGVTYTTDEAKVTVRDVPDHPGVAARRLRRPRRRRTSTST